MYNIYHITYIFFLKKYALIRDEGKQINIILDLKRLEGSWSLYLGDDTKTLQFQSVERCSPLHRDTIPKWSLGPLGHYALS